MSLVINAPKVEGRLRIEAAKRGVSVAEYAVAILASHLEPTDEEANQAPFHATATADEWIAAFDSWVDSHENSPSLPDSALSRESFYESRS
jgi:hypothetical protein